MYKSPVLKHFGDGNFFGVQILGSKSFGPLRMFAY